MSDSRSIEELCMPAGSPQSLYVAGEMVGYLKALTDLAAFLPARWINEHGSDTAGAALWMLKAIGDVKAGRAG